MTAYKEEIFGPVLCVINVDTLDEAIEVRVHDSWIMIDEFDHCSPRYKVYYSISCITLYEGRHYYIHRLYMEKLNTWPRYHVDIYFTGTARNWILDPTWPGYNFHIYSSNHQILNTWPRYCIHIYSNLYKLNTWPRYNFYIYSNQPKKK